MQLLYQGRDIMLSREELLKMREMTFEDIDPKEIQDVEKLKIDVKKSKPEKVREILESETVGSPTGRRILHKSRR